MSQLKAAADFYWKLKVDGRKFEVRDVARIYGVDASELQKELVERVTQDLRASIDKRKLGKKGDVA